MGCDPQQAEEALRRIERVQQGAARHSENNGVLQLVWGAAIIVAMAGFDIFPRFAGSQNRALGPLLAGLFVAVVALGTAIWTGVYSRRLPVQPWKSTRKQIFLLWGLYHILVICGGTFLGLFLFGKQEAFLPVWFTCVGLLSGLPLLIVGLFAWRRAQIQKG
ncbi:hypothetical protein EPA93_29985 [Ktedonosporobacter rubrisoli]|uniref:Uncharacterized protein n=1 Tax=Ktedonosporobacter rubrisoli TaxID=2509675 RepID=A0A4P6JWM6_KTERU|nr:hypothetical protein [Ktedonosporobacter rubrisoli]QBD79984.1 hypothetical protein EPA93_29985 [Ktedonosporobacter rubrisoli]